MCVPTVLVYMPPYVLSFLCLMVTRLRQDFSRCSSGPTYCFVLPHLIIQIDGQNKGRGYCGSRVNVSAFVCVCERYAWVEAVWRRRCCREQKHFADVAGKKEWMESSVVISRTAHFNLRRYATCGPIPTLSHFSRFRKSLDLESIEKLQGNKKKALEI